MSITQTYRNKTPGSAVLAERARALMPSGLSHDGRITNPYPIYVKQAQGPRKWDVDGNAYVDYFGGHGSLLLGHNHPTLVEALRQQTARGTHFGACHEPEIEWAALVQGIVPSAQKVRFTSSGTEATLLGLRVARALTGKTKILRVRGHFHGWHDHMTAGYVSHFDGTPTSGVVAGITAETILVDADDLAGLREAFSRRDIAAAIVEPTGAHFSRMPLADAFLREMRELTSVSGAILIFDEVVTGFRVAPGGYQSIVGITPDMTTLAKILAGGLPGGALVGRADVMDVLDFYRAKEAGFERVAHQGTFNGNPLSAAAGVAMLREMQSGNASKQASEYAKSLRDGLNKVFKEEGVPWFVYGDFSGFHTFLNPRKRRLDPGVPVQDILAEDLLGGPVSLAGPYRTALLTHGVDVNAAGSGWVSATHGTEELALTLHAMRNVIKDFRGEKLIE